MAHYRSTVRLATRSWRSLAWAGACAGLIAALAGCSSGAGSVQTASGQAADAYTQDYPIFYVKRYSVPATQDDLRLLRFAQPSADLFMRSNASSAGTETNVTQSITGTGTKTAANYDIKDVSVSQDGTTILFAMRGPLAAKQQQDEPPSWRIWQYVIATGALSPVINPTTDPDPLTVNDTAASFLPDGRIVFSSTRQRQAEAAELDEGFPQFVAEDEDRTEPAAVLHVMNADGTDIHEISFNASHDRDASVLGVGAMSGRVMWTRWDDPPAKDGMQLYTSWPDGTDMELLYGANSHQTGPNGTATANTTVEFVKAHEMQDGRILALIRPFTGAESATAPLGTDFGGDLIIIDTPDYVENTQPAAAGSSLTGPAQTNATTNNVITIPGPSPGGRFYAGYPLWDGTGRILVSWSQCRLVDTTSKTPNTYLPCTAANLASPTATAAPPIYSVWMFNPSQNTLQPIGLPTDGIMITDLVAAQPRAVQRIVIDGTGVPINQNFLGAGVGVIDIRSVYDFEGQDTAQPNIPTVANPGLTTAAQRQARFIRIVQAVPIPDKKTLNLSDEAFGASNFMRMISGYAPVEPDGSVRLQVPANVPFQIDVLDVNAQRINPNVTGPGIPTHNAWLQVAPGEEIHCNGCHTPASAQNPAPGMTAVSHGRAGLFNSAWPGAPTTGVAFFSPNTVSTFSPNQGDTMAETRSRWSCSNDTPACLAMMLSPEVLYTDVWTNTAAGLTLNPPITYSYTNLPATVPAPTTNSCVASWSPTCRILINYPENIQPIWDYKRQTIVNGVVTSDHTCNQGGCHAPVTAQNTVQVPAGQLDLTSSACQANAQELSSYCALLFAHDEQTVNNGALVDVLVPGPIDPTTGQPTMVPVQVSAPMLAGDAHDSTAFFSQFGNGGQHAGWLSPDELRLLSEWLDIGAQNFNNPFDPKAPLN